MRWQGSRVKNIKKRLAAGAVAVAVAGAAVSAVGAATAGEARHATGAAVLAREAAEAGQPPPKPVVWELEDYERNTEEELA